MSDENLTLTERKAAILQAVVESYIATSEPVGSSHIVKTAGLDVSSATVRSDMVALEEAGYLHQPHTSAGRVPSDKGYRYFVDSLMEPHAVGATEQRKVSSFFGAAQGELERMLSDTSTFLAQLTDHAAVIVGPSTTEHSPLRGVQVVRLADEQAMVVLVRANAMIDKHLVAISAAVTDTELDAAAAQLVAVHVDRENLTRAVDPGADQLYDSLEQALLAPSDETALYVGGTSTVAGIFDAVDQVQEVLRVLEKHYLVVTLIKDVIDRGRNVAIGSETGVEPLAECSLVVAPVEVDGVITGSVGVLGPTRMDYAQAVATVGLVSQQLGQHLQEGHL